MSGDKQPPSTGSRRTDGNGIEQVQTLLNAVQRSLGGAHDKYQVLEEKYKKKDAELAESRQENAQLKKRLLKLQEELGRPEDASRTAPFRPSRVTDEKWLRDVYLNTSKRAPPKLIRGTCGNAHAFAVLVMNRDAYALGAAVLAHRLKKLNTTADTVCMVTRDVSLGVVEALASEFTAVFQVPYLEYGCHKMTTKKQQKYYGHWIERSFTKWNVLALSMYKKVVLLDADLLPVSNIDHLFDTSAPAATFSSPWAKTFRKDGYDDPYKGLRHGDLVDHSMIRDAIEISLRHSERADNKGSYVALGSVVLLEPSITCYGIFNAFVCSQQPFGIPGCHSGFDEQSIVLFYYLQNPKTRWTHISQGYNALCWHESWLEGCDVKCYHYFNAKPWEMPPDMYPDLKMWYQALHELARENTQSGDLMEVCMSDTSFLDTFVKMTADKSRITDSKSKGDQEPLPLKPVLPHDGGSTDGSGSSSPRVSEQKSTKPPPAGGKNKLTSSSTDGTSDPPKTDPSPSDKALSVCSDGGRSSKHSETASVKSRESSRSASQRRPIWYDEYEPSRPVSKDYLRVRHSESRQHGRQSPSSGAGSEDYGPVYGRDGLLRRSAVTRRDPLVPPPEYRRMRKYASNQERYHDFVPHGRVSSEVYAPKPRLVGSYGDGTYDRTSRHHAMSHSPVHGSQPLGRFESFGSSTSSGSHRLTPKYERRQHF